MSKMTNCTKEAQNDVVKPKNDAIDSICRVDAIAVIRKNHYRLQGKGMTEEVLIADLEALPSAEPKTGEWIKRFDGNEWFWYCSACKEQWYEDDLYMGGNEFPDYCPNCGSYNGGKADEDMG